jgi:chromate reductase, NAD(P)H dehydrogenase (quinone)
MKRILIISQTSQSGLNGLQMMEIVNILGGKGLEISTKKEANDVEHYDITNADKIIMIVPEWNGSFPWTFKKLIDFSGYPSVLEDKPILLVGTSSSTFGNLMGITQLSSILGWVGANVYSKPVCVPFINKKFAKNDIIVDERLNEEVLKFVNNF